MRYHWGEQPALGVPETGFSVFEARTRWPPQMPQESRLQVNRSSEKGRLLWASVSGTAGLQKPGMGFSRKRPSHKDSKKAAYLGGDPRREADM